MKLGVIHSQLGMLDGVSIVASQIQQALTRHAGFSDGDFAYLAGKGQGLPSLTIAPLLWHRHSENLFFLEHFSSEPPPGDLASRLEAAVRSATGIFQRWFTEINPDVVLVHNACHPTNLILALGWSAWLASRRRQGLSKPRYVVWWHDSHLERERFSRPSTLLRSKLAEGVPGPLLDAVVCINSGQPPLVRRYLEDLGVPSSVRDEILSRCRIIPNTAEIPERWPNNASLGPLRPRPRPAWEEYLEALGVTPWLGSLSKKPEEVVLLLQHTRIVRRKRLDTALDLAYRLAEALHSRGGRRAVALLVSGNSGDELDPYLEEILTEHARRKASSAAEVGLFLAETADRATLPFDEFPGLVASRGGLGVYCSELEGYGNNLLEMIAWGLPVIVNRYPVFVSDIAPLGFRLVELTANLVTEETLASGLALLDEFSHRDEVVLHNLELLERHCGHRIIADLLGPLLRELA
ncbi:MAG: hypothetical protein A2284_10100 [Deltaproteobacteria bacterium RIFOXYA12_FULL_61_11]|nr:MAG: hypothetical protein A2284_10100 [Deltaproteobacteria bacterium RIFOXYA12_FULL_61_11]